MADKKVTPACWTWPEPSRAQIQEAGSDPAAQWALLWEWHEGRCAICSRRPRRLVEDHSHATALTRGFLCDQCNVREGARYGGEYAMYRECSPAVILGVDLRYVDRVTGFEAEPERVLTEEERERQFAAARAALDRAFGATSI